MAVIQKKNFLNLGAKKRQRIWDEIRDEPFIHRRVTLGDLPGIGGALALVIRWSVSAQGIAEFLFGDDPGEMTTYTVSPLPEV